MYRVFGGIAFHDSFDLTIFDGKNYREVHGDLTSVSNYIVSRLYCKLTIFFTPKWTFQAMIDALPFYRKKIRYVTFWGSFVSRSTSKSETEAS